MCISCVISAGGPTIENGACLTLFAFRDLCVVSLLPSTACASAYACAYWLGRLEILL